MAKFLTDNGGEFTNSTFLSMCDSLGIVIKTTAEEWPWSNGLVDRQNLWLADMLDKVLEETQCDLELAIVWHVSTKNSHSNIHGFSPYQLAISTNPKLPSVINYKAPALTATPLRNITSNNLKAIHKARVAFIASKISETIRRDLAHNIRTSGDTKYITRDHVYLWMCRQQRMTWPSNSIRPRWTTTSHQKWKLLFQSPPLSTSVDNTSTPTHSWNWNIHHQSS